MNEKILKTIATLLTIVGVAIGAYLYIDSRYALCAEVRSLERRLDYKIENDVLMGMKQRQWQLQAQFPKPDQAPPGVQQRLREIEHDIDMQKKKVEKLEGR